MNKLYLIFIFFVTVSFIATDKNSPNKSKYFPKDLIYYNPQKQDSLSPFYLSRHLTTNKEYLTFILWQYFTERNSSDQYKCAHLLLPQNQEKSNKLFNPKYDLEPITGLTNEQIMNYCIWKTARTNEYILIREKKLRLDFKTLLIDNTFSLETFVLGAFAGDVIKQPGEFYEFDAWRHDVPNFFQPPIWSDDFIIPTYRLPQPIELEYALSKQFDFFSAEVKTIDESIEFYYIGLKEAIKNYWITNGGFNEGAQLDLENRMDLYFNYAKSSDEKKSTSYKPVERVFEPTIKPSKYKNYGFVYSIIKDSTTDCLEKDIHGQLNSICNQLIISSQNNFPVFIKYQPFLQEYNKNKCYTYKGYIPANTNEDIVSESGFRVALFAPHKR